MNVVVPTIIPTVGRETFSGAVQSVTNQTFHRADFEVIVVNDSGRALPDMGRKDLPNLQIINTNRRERSGTRNSGSAIARGKHLHFLDDDDWLLPGALDTFWNLGSRCPRAVWLYGGIQIVDGQLLYSFALFALSIKYLSSREYWAGLTADHVPETLHFVMKDYDRNSHYKKLNLNSGN